MDVQCPALPLSQQYLLLLLVEYIRHPVWWSNHAPSYLSPQSVGVLFLFIFRELSLVDNVFVIKQMKLDYLKLWIISFFCAVRIWIEAWQTVNCFAAVLVSSRISPAGNSFLFLQYYAFFLTYNSFVASWFLTLPHNHFFSMSSKSHK